MHKTRKGFNPIELLVMMAITAVLMGILIPALSHVRVRTQARAVLCRSNLKQWGTVFNIYTSENDGEFMTLDQNGSTGTPFMGYWFDSLSYYHATEDIRMCPAVKKLINPDMDPNTRVTGDTFTGWGKVRGGSGNNTEGVYGSYGINAWVYQPENDAMIHGMDSRCFWGSMNVPGLDRIPLFMDCILWATEPEADHDPPIWSAGEEPDGGYWPVHNSMGRVCINRHDGAINILFMDGHVDNVGLKKLWEKKWHRNYDTHNKWTLRGGISDDNWPLWLRDL